MNINLKQLSILDTLGGFISLACAIHCLLVPVLTVAWPFFGSTFFADASFHKALLYLVVPVAVISLGWGCRHHHNFRPLIVGCVGLGILVYFTLSEGDECAHCVEQTKQFGLAFWNWSSDVLLQRVGLILGAALLCWAHWNNFKTCKKSDCKNPKQGTEVAC